MPFFPAHTPSSLRRKLTVGLGALAALVLTSCGLTQASSTEGDAADKTISLIVTESAPYQ